MREHNAKVLGEAGFTADETAGRTETVRAIPSAKAEWLRRVAGECPYRVESVICPYEHRR
jgi:hypothetical protein